LKWAEQCLMCVPAHVRRPTSVSHIHSHDRVAAACTVLCGSVIAQAPSIIFQVKALLCSCFHE
jgi:hypothetical protein